MQKGVYIRDNKIRRISFGAMSDKTLDYIIQVKSLKVI